MVKYSPQRCVRRRKTRSEAPGLVQERDEHGVEKRNHGELGLTGLLSNVGIRVAEKGKKAGTRVLTGTANL